MVWVVLLAVFVRSCVDGVCVDATVVTMAIIEAGRLAWLGLIQSVLLLLWV